MKKRKFLQPSYDLCLMQVSNLNPPLRRASGDLTYQRSYSAVSLGSGSPTLRYRCNPPPLHVLHYFPHFQPQRSANFLLYCLSVNIYFLLKVQIRIGLQDFTTVTRIRIVYNIRYGSFIFKLANKQVSNVNSKKV